MKNKQIREMLNVQQVQYESKQTLEIMRQNTSYPTTRKFNYITFAAVNIILLLMAVGACFFRRRTADRYRNLCCINSIHIKPSSKRGYQYDNRHC